jgi:hypothetical protein
MILLPGIIGGCTGVSQNSVYYVFNASQEQSTVQSLIAQRGLGLGPIKIPEFLKRPQIVTRQGENVLAISEFHRWGDSLEAQITGVLVENLSALLNTSNVSAYPWERPFAPAYQLYIDIRHFEGEIAGSITLEAVWWIVEIENNKRLLTRRSSLIEPTDGEGYMVYVIALNTSLEKLSQEIARGIIETLP